MPGELATDGTTYVYTLVNKYRYRRMSIQKYIAGPQVALPGGRYAYQP